MKRRHLLLGLPAALLAPKPPVVEVLETGYIIRAHWRNAYNNTPNLVNRGIDLHKTMPLSALALR